MVRSKIPWMTAVEALRGREVRIYVGIVFLSWKSELPVNILTHRGRD